MLPLPVKGEKMESRRNLFFRPDFQIWHGIDRIQKKMAAWNRNSEVQGTLSTQCILCHYMKIIQSADGSTKQQP